MNARPTLAVLLLAALAASALISCKAARQVGESAEELVVDAWAPVVGVALGSLAGPAGMIVGGTLGGAYAVTRQRLYSAQELSEAYRTGEIFGRQQAKDLADAARGASIQAHPTPAAEAPLITLRRLGLGVLAYLVVVGWLRRHKWRRVREGPDRLRALENLYLGPLAPLPEARVAAADS